MTSFLTLTTPQPYEPDLGHNQPPAYLIGWCHQCGVVQFGRDARHLNPLWHAPYYPEKLWLCTTPDCDEPWGLGIWISSPCESCLPPAMHQAAGKLTNWDGVCRAVQYGEPDCVTGEPTSARSAQAVVLVDQVQPEEPIEP